MNKPVPSSLLVKRAIDTAAKFLKESQSMSAAPLSPESVAAPQRTVTDVFQSQVRKGGAVCRLPLTVTVTVPFSKAISVGAGMSLPSPLHSHLARSESANVFVKLWKMSLAAKYSYPPSLASFAK